MNPLTLTELFQAICDMVAGWPVVDHQPNTFVVIDNLSNLSTAGGSKTQFDLQNRIFFSRKTYNAGNAPGEIVLQHPVVGAFCTERKSNLDTEFYKIELVCIDKVTDKTPTKTEVEQYTYRILQTIHQRIIYLQTIGFLGGICLEDVRAGFFGIGRAHV